MRQRFLAEEAEMNTRADYALQLKAQEIKQKAEMEAAKLQQADQQKRFEKDQQAGQNVAKQLDALQEKPALEQEQALLSFEAQYPAGDFPTVARLIETRRGKIKDFTVRDAWQLYYNMISDPNQTLSDLRASLYEISQRSPEETALANDLMVKAAEYKITQAKNALSALYDQRYVANNDELRKQGQAVIDGLLRDGISLADSRLPSDFEMKRAQVQNLKGPGTRRQEIDKAVRAIMTLDRQGGLTPGERLRQMDLVFQNLNSDETHKILLDMVEKTQRFERRDVLRFLKVNADIQGVSSTTLQDRLLDAQRRLREVDLDTDHDPELKDAIRKLEDKIQAGDGGNPPGGGGNLGGNPPGDGGNPGGNPPGGGGNPGGNPPGDGGNPGGNPPGGGGNPGGNPPGDGGNPGGNPPGGGGNPGGNPPGGGGNPGGNPPGINQQQQATQGGSGQGAAPSGDAGASGANPSGADSDPAYQHLLSHYQQQQAASGGADNAYLRFLSHMLQQHQQHPGRSPDPLAARAAALGAAPYQQQSQAAGAQGAAAGTGVNLSEYEDLDPGNIAAAAAARNAARSPLFVRTTDSNQAGPSGTQDQQQQQQQAPSQQQQQQASAPFAQQAPSQQQQQQASAPFARASGPSPDAADIQQSVQVETDDEDLRAALTSTESDNSVPPYTEDPRRYETTQQAAEASDARAAATNPLMSSTDTEDSQGRPRKRRRRGVPRAEPDEYDLEDPFINDADQDDQRVVAAAINLAGLQGYSRGVPNLAERDANMAAAGLPGSDRFALDPTLPRVPEPPILPSPQQAQAASIGRGARNPQRRIVPQRVNEPQEDDAEDAADEARRQEGETDEAVHELVSKMFRKVARRRQKEDNEARATAHRNRHDEARRQQRRALTPPAPAPVDVRRNKRRADELVRTVLNLLPQQKRSRPDEQTQPQEVGPSIAGVNNEWRRLTDTGRRRQFTPAQTAAVGERRRLVENVDDAGQDMWEIPQRPRYRQAIIHRNPDLEDLVDAIVEAVMATPTLAEHRKEDGPF